MEGNTSTNVARAIVVALDWNSTTEARKAAVSYLDSIKAGDIGVLASSSFVLVKRDWSSEIRLHAFKMLQHLVRLRWDELSPVDRRNFSNLAVELMSEIANPCEEWALKSQTAALVAEIVRREGLTLWQEMLPAIASLSSSGPVQAELVAMMLRWLPEDITVHNEDLEGDRRRWLLRGLTESLPDVFPLLYNLLEKHFGAAMTEVTKQQLGNAKQHAAAVTATLNAINAYAEWAPLSDLEKYGIIRGCGFLLSSRDFRLHACEFFKLVAPRKKKPLDPSAAEFDSGMTQIFQVLMHVSEEFLNKSRSNAEAMDESEFEFAEYICEAMVSLGSSNLQCIAGNNLFLSLYLQEMLGFFKHFKLALHSHSLQLLLALMRDLMSKGKSTSHSAGNGSAVNSLGSARGSVDNEKSNILCFFSDDCCSEILDTSFKRMLKREKVNPETAISLEPLELWSDDFECKGDFGQYRSKLLELVKFVTSYKPLIAAAKISERVTAVIQSPLSSPTPAKDLAVMDSLQFALENVVSAIYDGSDETVGSPEVHLALCRAFEGLLQLLLSLKWTEPTLVQMLGHYLDALGPFLKYFPDAVGSVVNKLFELLNSLPFVVQDPSTNSARHARLQICTSFIRIAKAADKSILPHMKDIADTMAFLQRQGCLLRGEHNLLGEAFLIMASAGGIQQQQEVLAWLLEPLSQQWTQLEWQNNYLSEPLGIVRLCSETAFMWSIFHTVTFFEKALKRSGIKKGNLNPQNNLTPNSASLHPMASHLSWMLPPLLKLLRSIHSLWSPSVIQTLPEEMKAAMTMSEVERFGLFVERNPKTSKGTSSYADGSHVDMNKEGSVDNESDVRNWLKGVRDSGYNVLGLSMTIGDPFFNGLDPHSIRVAIMENIQSMEFRHIKQLVHNIFIPLIKSCPSNVWNVWLESLLHPLLFHTQEALSCSWSSLLRDGRAKVPDSHGIVAGSSLKVEVMEEEILRDLTREICSLLLAMSSPTLNTGLPPLEQSGHIVRVEISSRKDLDAFVQSSMVSCILRNKSLAVSALRICLEAFTWTDCQSVTKISYFCTAVVQLTTSTNNVELQEFVSNDLFPAIIKSLSNESNAIISADLVGLLRVIFVCLCDRDPSPRRVLLALPSITHQDLNAFEEALTKTCSPKEQKQHMRSLLMLATGNQLKALAAQKTVNVITNVTSRPSGSAGSPETRTNDADSVGLAGIGILHEGQL